MGKKLEFVKTEIDESKLEECPETKLWIRILFPLQLFYIWLIPFVVKGYKKILTLQDLPKLYKAYKGYYYVNRFKKLWAKFSSKRAVGLVLTIIFCFGLEFAFYGIFQLIATICNVCYPFFLSRVLSNMQPLFSSDDQVELDRFMNILPSDLAPGESYLDGFRFNSWEIWMYLAIMLGFQILSLVFQEFCMYCTAKMGMKIRNVLTSIIYEKCLKVTVSGRRKNNPGKILSILMQDLMVLEFYSTRLHYAWGSVLLLIIVFTMLFFLIGFSIVFSIIVALLIIPMIVGINIAFYFIRKKYSQYGDERVNAMNEVFQGIQIIKYFAWEEPYLKRIAKARKKQLIILRIAFLLSLTMNVFIVTSTPLMMFAGLLGYVLSNANVSSVLVLSCIAYFNICRAPLVFFPEILTQLFTALISFRRIASFLIEKEIEPWKDYKNEEFPLVIENADFEWVPIPSKKTGKGGKKVIKIEEKELKEKIKDDEKQITSEEVVIEEKQHNDPREKPNKGKLINVNLKVKKGELIIICGKVGSGKSSLLSGIIGEMPLKNDGKVEISGMIAYCNQQSWIQNCTLKDNILFGKEEDGEKLEIVIDSCALGHDITVIEGGVNAEIGEKGVNLSGGQKARIALARAVYNDADIYLLDDVLSAVDSHVGKHIFNECIRGLLKDKTIILVTHQLQYCPRADRVVFIGDEGKIDQIGSFEELIDSKGEFQKMVEENMKELQKEKENEEIVEVKENEKKEEDKKEEKNGKKSSKGKKLIQKEERATGSLSLRVVHDFIINLGGYHVTFFLLLVFVVSMFLYLFNEWWITNFASRDYFHEKYGNTYNTTYCHLNNTTVQNIHLIDTNVYNISNLTCANEVVAITWDDTYSDGELLSYGLNNFQSLLIYCATSLLLPVIFWIRGSLAFWYLVSGSQKLFINAVRRILFGKMTWFYSTPVGRIMNRFSKDVSAVDIQLTFFLFLSLGVGFSILFNLFLVCYTTYGVFVPIILIVFVLFGILFQFYRKTSREVKRINSVSISPFISHVSESLNGISTIRAYKRETEFMEVNRYKYDVANRSHFLSIAMTRWMIVVMNILGYFITFVTALISIIIAYYANFLDIPIPILSLGITKMSSVVFLLSLTTFFLIESEVRMNSVERLIYYAKNIPIEADYKDVTKRLKEIKEKVVEPFIVEEGEVRFENYSMRYRDDLPIVLNKLNFTIEPNTSVGVCGRTGAGKTSLFTAIMRIVEGVEGTIYIDDQDVRDICLTELRSSIAIIPQDPLLFSGTIRSNLDPFDRHTDMEIWNALERSHLSTMMKRIGEAGLNATVEQNGSNFSVGERQMLCLARALLKKTKLLLLDECTANVDMESDRLIQATIRKEFKGTMLTIAHRLSTIIDYDKILVMDKGIVSEFGSPYELAHKKGSIFRQLIDETPNSDFLLKKICVNDVNEEDDDKSILNKIIQRMSEHKKKRNEIEKDMKQLKDTLEVLSTAPAVKV